MPAPRAEIGRGEHAPVAHDAGKPDRDPIEAAQRRPSLGIDEPDQRGDDIRGHGGVGCRHPAPLPQDRARLVHDPDLEVAAPDVDRERQRIVDIGGVVRVVHRTGSPWHWLRRPNMPIQSAQC
jgi:hypothetical protein